LFFTFGAQAYDHSPLISFRDMWIFHQLFISVVAAKQKESKPVGDGTELAIKTGKRP